MIGNRNPPDPATLSPIGPQNTLATVHSGIPATLGQPSPFDVFDVDVNGDLPPKASPNSTNIDDDNVERKQGRIIRSLKRYMRPQLGW